MSIRKETGEKREFSTGAKRQAAAGKGTPVLFPGDAYLEVCKHFEEGAIHYSGRNWEKGLPLSTFIDSIERHIAQEKMGLTDESHDRAIAWNGICYLATKLRIKAGILPAELDDLCGAYREIPKAIKVETENGFKISRVRTTDGVSRYYIIPERNEGYLWNDLKLHKYCCTNLPPRDTEGYFSTKKAAEECLAAYLAASPEVTSAAIAVHPKCTERFKGQGGFAP